AAQNSRSTSRTRSHARRASHTKARYSRSPWPHEHDTFEQHHGLRPGRVHRHRDHLEGPDDAAHAAHVGDERDPRHRPRRRDAHRRLGRLRSREGARVRRGRLRHDQRRRRLPRHRPHARDVQAQALEAGSRMTPLLALSQTAINFTYLVAAVLLIVGIRRLSSPPTARSGNWIAAVGMGIAIFFTFLSPEITSYWLIFAGMAVGTVIGVVSARLVKMTAIPQMVALFNGVGGGAAALIAAAEFHRIAPDPGHLSGDSIGAMLFSALIGSISFSGSLIAFGKLQEVLPGRPITFAGQQVVNAVLFAALLALGVLAGSTEQGIWLVL